MILPGLDADLNSRADQIDAWLAGHLTEQQRADLFGAVARAGARFTGDRFAITLREVVESVKHHLAHAGGLSQLDAVAGLACGAFGDKLHRMLDCGGYCLGFGSTSPFGFQPSPDLRNTNAFGQMVSYRIEASDSAAAELNELIGQLTERRTRRLREITTQLSTAFTQLQGQAESIARLLDRVPLREGTLADPWRTAQEVLTGFWTEQLAQLASFRTDELDRLRSFVTQHPAWTQLPAAEREAAASLWLTGPMSLHDLAEATVVRLAQDLKRLLHAS